LACHKKKEDRLEKRPSWERGGIQKRGRPRGTATRIARLVKKKKKKEKKTKQKAPRTKNSFGKIHQTKEEGRRFGTHLAEGKQKLKKRKKKRKNNGRQKIPLESTEPMNIKVRSQIGIEERKRK